MERVSKYNIGDKVVIRKDLVDGVEYGDVELWSEMEYLKEKDYVVIDGVDEYGDYRLENTHWYITNEIIEGLYKGVKKYIWYLDSEDGTYFLNNLLGVDKWTLYETKEIKNGKDMCYLLMEEEARKSPFFDKFKKHDPLEEKWYYIHMKGNNTECLNLNVIEGRYSMDDNDEYGPHKVKFTEEECNEIIGTSSILYKEEC